MKRLALILLLSVCAFAQYPEFGANASGPADMGSGGSPSVGPTGAINVTDGAGGWVNTGCFIIVGQVICNPQPATRTIGGCPYFPGDYYFNSSIAGLPLDSQSATKISSLVSLSTSASAAIRLGPDPEFALNMATNSTAVPAYTWDEDSTVMDSASYPLVAGTSAGSSIVSGYTYGTVGYASSGVYYYPTYDAHLNTINTSNCFLYEIYGMQNNTPPWHAAGGWVWNMNDYRLRSAIKLQFYGVNTDGETSADAAGMIVAPLVYTHAEIYSGLPLLHAGRVAFVSSAVTPGFIWPATHTAAGTANNNIYLGTTFRLPAAFDTTTCHLNENNGLAYPSFAKALLTAFQTFGLYFTDYSGSGGNGLFSTDADQAWGDPSSPASDNYVLAGWMHCIPLSGLEIVDNTPRIISQVSGQVNPNYVAH